MSHPSRSNFLCLDQSGYWTWGKHRFFLSSDIRGSLRKYNEGGIQKKKMEIFNEIFHEIINHGYDFYLRRDNIDHIMYYMYMQQI